MLDTFTLATFTPLVHSRFEVRVADRDVVLELVSAHGDGPDDNPFVLVFSGRSAEFVPQGMYAFRHETLGAFELFVSPSTRNADVFTTEAVFNRAPPPRG